MISSVTRQSAETIGQSMKTMLARFTDIKAGKLDEDSLGLNSVETALARVNIKLRDSRNDFRNIQDVISDIGAKWSSLNEVEQDNIAKNIAGVRQKEQFLVLMNHQVDIQKALTTETEATGLATQRYGIYLEGAEASTNKLQTAWEKTWQTTMNSDGLIFLNNVGTKILEIVSNTGGWVKVIENIGRVLEPQLILVEQYLNRIIEIKDLVNGLSSSATTPGIKSEQSPAVPSFGKNPFDPSLPVAINNQTKATNELTDANNKLADSQDKVNKVYGPFLPTVEKATVPIFNLNSALTDLDGSVKNTGDLMAKAAANSLTFSDIQELIAKNPDFIDMISVQNGKIEINTDKLRQLDLEKAKSSLLTAQQVLAADQLNKANDDTLRKDQETIDVMQAYVNAILDGTAYAEQLAAANKKAAAEAKKAAEEQLKIYEDEKKAADDLLKLVIDMIKQEKQAEIDHLNQQKQNYDELIDKRIQALDALKAENDYQASLKKDEKKSADIKSQIAILKLDNSPEAKAKILKLQEDLANQTDKINKEIADHKLKLEKDALQQEKKRFDDSIKDKVQVIQNYLKQTGQIAQDAMELLQNHGQELYNRLLEWNRVYGDGIDQTIIDAWNKGYDAVLHYQELLSEISSQKALIDNPDLMNTNVIQPWKDATAAVQDYNKALAESLTGQQAADEWLKNHPPKTGGSGDGLGTAAGGTSQGDGLGTAAGGSGWTGGGLGSSAGGVKAFHSGLDVGPAGGLRTKDNDTIRAMLAPDEIVFNGRDQANLLHSFIPNIIKSTSNINQGGNTFKFDNLINIEGNADRTMIPDLNKLADTVIEKLNTATQNRGIKRPVNLFGNL